MNREEKSERADPPSGGSGSGRLKRKACAACRQQRNRCTEDCLLAPHFPAECHDQFMNAHNLYGVGNMHSMLRRLYPVYHSDAMKTVKYESDVRAGDRAGGCYRIILQLREQCQSLINELNLVNQHLSFFRNQTNPSDNDEGNANDNNVTVSTDYDQQPLQNEDQLDLTFFCSDVDATADGAMNRVLNEDNANILVDDHAIAAAYNGNDEGNANNNNVTVSTNYDQQPLQNEDQLDLTFFCSDVDASVDDAPNYFLDEDDANMLVDNHVITAAYNGNDEPALLAHGQQFPDVTDRSVCLLPKDDYRA